MVFDPLSELATLRQQTATIRKRNFVRSRLAATISIITFTRTCSLMTCVKVAIAQQKPTLDTLGGFCFTWNLTRRRLSQILLLFRSRELPQCSRQYQRVSCDQ